MEPAKRFKTNSGSIVVENREILIGRKGEFDFLLDTISQAILSSLPHSLLISGKSGTGKTMTTTAVLEEISRRKTLKQGVHTIYINAMNVQSSKALYDKVLSQINTRTKHDASLLEICCRHYKKEKMLMIIIDEADNLYSSNKKLLLNLLSLPHETNSRLILIGISNAVDLVSKLSPDIDRIQPHTVLVFKPYSQSEILTILKERYKNHDYQEKALELCARQVDKQGDARRAIEICNSLLTQGSISLENALKSSSKRSYGALNVMKNLPHQQRIVLGSIVSYLEGQSMTISAAYAGYRLFCHKLTAESIPQADFLDTVAALTASGLLNTSGKGKDKNRMQMEALVNVEEIRKVYADDPEVIELLDLPVSNSWKLKV
jgi:Cdc6-like AAA superfamily ATPase